MMKHFVSLILLFLSLFILLGCSDIQDNYTEVYAIVEGEMIFYYVMPGDGEASISRNRMDVELTTFIYIYNANDFETFSYENFFSPLGEYQVHKDRYTGKLYIYNNEDIEKLIYQHSLDYDVWKANQNG